MFKNILTIAVMVFAFGLPTAGQAADMDFLLPGPAGIALFACLDAGDAQTATDANGGDVCCSKALGYCIDCRGDDLCARTPYSDASGSVLQMLTKPAVAGEAIVPVAPKPPSLRDRMKGNKAKLPVAAKVAPVAPVKKATPAAKLKKLMKAKMPTKAPASR